MCFPEEEEAFHSLENSNEYVLIDTVCALPLQLVLWIILFVWQQKFHANKRQQCNPWYRFLLDKSAVTCNIHLRFVFCVRTKKNLKECSA